MRKFLGFCFLILCTASLYAQTTSVTGTITDSNSVVWANSSWTLSFVPSQQQPNINAYTIGGVPLSSTVINQTGVANSSGVFSFTAYQIGSINPSGGQFKLVICPTASVPCSQLLFTTGSNSTLDLSSQMTATFKPPSFVAVPGTFGYDDSEATLALRIANTYFNVTLGVNHVWNGSAWINPGGGGGVSEILEGTNVTCSPLVSSSCVGNVTINASGGGGSYQPSSLSLPPASSGFSWVNQGGNSVATTSGGVEVLTIVELSSTSWSLRSLAVPGSTPWSIASAFSNAAQGTSVSANVGGLYLYDGTKLEGIECLDTGSGGELRVEHITNVTTDGSTVYGPHSMYNSEINTASCTGGVTYMRWRNDGTNIYADVSPDGVSWQNVYSEAVGAYLSTITQYGWGGLDEGGSSTYLKVDLGGWLATNSAAQ